jgi:hypothetical protein
MGYFTVNYLFATYLQTKEGGGHKIERVEKVRPGKAKFHFNLSPEEAEEIQLRFHKSACSEFESLRKSTIDLAYVLPLLLYPLAATSLLWAINTIGNMGSLAII